MAGYDSIIAEASRRFNVPEGHIRAVMQVESGGRPGAISNRGAGGLMQIMPATYDELRGRHGLGADRFDPTNNIMAGTAYLRENNDRFGGDWDKTFAAYNGGPNRVARGGPLPAETRNYVPKVNSMIPTLTRPRPGQTIGQGVSQGREAELRGLLDFEMPPAGNHLDGLGVLANTGQTPQQSPRPGEAVGGRIDELIGQLAQPYDRGPQMTPGQYQIAGMTNAATQLAGIHNRKVGFGELLGAIGGGLVKGTQAGEEAARQQRAAEFGELGNLSKLQQHQRGEATAARQMQAANAYAAQIEKINPGLAAALRNNPALMDEIAKAQAQQQFAKDETTPLVRNAIAAGLRPGTPEFNKFIQDNAGNAPRINLNTAENTGARELASDRVNQYSTIRAAGTSAVDLEKKLDLLETVLGEVGTTGPATPTISKLIGIAQQIGVPPDQITAFYNKITGVDPADPAKVDIANKLINDFVTSSISKMGVNTSDTDLATLQAAMPHITNQAEANRHIIQNILRPQLRKQRALWDRVRPLGRGQTALETLDDEIATFETEWAEQNKPKDSQQASPAQGDPPPQGMTPPEPGAVWSANLNAWVKPDPSRPGKWMVAK